MAFLWWASLRNRVRKQVERLRQPKYLVGMVVGGAYLYFLILRRFSFRTPVEALPPGARMVAELVAAGILMAMLVAGWALGQDRPSLSFSETEVQQLFPAPISRRALLHYKLARGFFGAMTGAFFTTIFMGRVVSPHPVLFFVGATVALTTVNLHVTAASFVRTRLARFGWPGTVIRWGLLGGLFAVFGWSVYQAFLAHPFSLEGVGSGNGGLDRVKEWLPALVEEPGVQRALWPGRALAGLPMADGAEAFLRALPLALGLLVLHYLWVAALVVPFEEAVVVRAEATARRLQRRMAQVGHIVLRRPFFRLGPRGRPAVALLWKNLVAARRIGGPDIVFVLAALGLAFPVGVAFFAPEALPMACQVMVAVYLGLALTLTLFGPVSMRADLRIDLPKLDMLRAMPLTGRQIVLAELLAPGLLLAAMQVVLLTLAVGMAMGAPGKLGAELWVAGGLGLLPLLPMLSIGGLFVHNAGVVLFPSWLPSNGERARGLEALGQRLLTFVGSLVVLVGGLIPAAIVAALVGFALYGWLGVWALPFAGLTASAGLAFEVAVGVAALGVAFDRMDVSSEGPGAP
jgi:ABC-2 type transport system permease protein